MADLNLDKHKSKFLLSGDFMSDVMSNMDFPNALKDFTEVGKDINEALTHTYLNEGEEKQIFLLIAKLEEFGLLDEIELVIKFLSARRSVGGIAMKQLLAAITQTFTSDGINGKQPTGLMKRFKKQEED
ncbi:MAG: hypothetical protein FWH42_04200 [Dehalococcoidia bacterium]|nr:hypothetical protein [Dehalococcoidia bacterium]